MTDRRYVLVVWVDPTSGTHGWKDLKDVAAIKPPVANSVGWIVNETDEFLTLISHQSEDEVDGEVCIPRACIRQVQELKAVE
jgi:hypothetical protein